MTSGKRRVDGARAAIFGAFALALAIPTIIPAETGASIRTVAGLVNNSGGASSFSNSSAFSESLLRVTWAEWLAGTVHAEVHLVQNAVAIERGFTQDSRSTTALTTGGESYRALDLTWEQNTNNSFTSQLWLDRASIRITLGSADITIGRQPVTFGQAHFWNPLDVFFSFDPRQFDRDYKPGVDAIRADFALGDFTSLTFVAGAGSDESVNLSSKTDDFWNSNWSGSAVVTHLRTTINGWDATLQAGKVFGGYQTGAGLSGEMFSLEARLETAYFWRENTARMIPGLPETDFLADNLQLVVGAGKLLTPDLHIEGEYLFNSAGAGGPDGLAVGLARFLGGTLPQAGRHTVGEITTVQLSPLWNGSLALLWSAGDGSGVLQPGVTFSAASEIDLLAGAVINWGARPQGMYSKSEFGSFPDSYYLEGKYYFW